MITRAFIRRNPFWSEGIPQMELMWDAVFPLEAERFFRECFEIPYPGKIEGDFFVIRTITAKKSMMLAELYNRLVVEGEEVDSVMSWLKKEEEDDA